MNVLILGGTLFLGRHLVDALLARGHAVTTFTRGTRPSPQMRGVTRLHGDRTIAEDLARIANRPWDAVIDTSSDEPAAVALSAERLPNARRYAYVSSVSVYDIRILGLTEDTPPRAAGVDDPDAGIAFGARKAADARPVWADEAFLVANGLEGWTDLPLWIPGDEARGIMQVDISRALATGLRVRPLGETVAATRAWLEEEPPGMPPLAGITRERERELLERWHVATSS